MKVCCLSSLPQKNMRGLVLFLSFFAFFSISLFFCALVVLSSVPFPASAMGNDASSSAPRRASFRFGAAVAKTSNVALLGSEQLAGLEIAQAWMSGKLPEYKTPFSQMIAAKTLDLQIALEDSGPDEASAVNAFQRLIAQDVLAILGPTLSQQAFATDPIANRKGFPVLAISNTARGIPEIGDFVTRVSAPITAVAPRALQAALKKNPKIKRVIALYAHNDAFSSSESATFQELVKKQGLELLSVLKFQTTDADFSAQTREVLKAKPELVIISGLAADGGNLLKQLRQLGYDGVIVGGNGFNSPAVFPICQKYCEGLIVAQAYSPEAIKDNPLNAVFVQEFEKRYQRKPGQIAAQAFSAAQIGADSLTEVYLKDFGSDFSKQPNAKLREALNKKILNGQFNTPLGVIRFEPNGELIQQQFYVAELKMDSSFVNGRFVILEDH